MLVVNLDEKHIGIWDVSIGKLTQTLSFGSNAEINDADISPNSKWIVTASSGGDIVLWDIATGKQIQSFQHPTDRSVKVKFSPNSKYVMTYAEYESDVFLWNPLTGEKVYTLSKGVQPGDWLDFSPSGDYLLTQDKINFGVTLWDVNNGKQLKTFTPALSGAISPDNKLIVINQRVKLLFWNIATQSEIKTITLTHDAAGYESDPHIPQFSQDGKYLLFNYPYYNYSYLWSIEPEKPLYEIDGNSQFSKDGKQLIVTNAPRSNVPDDPSYTNIIQLSVSNINLESGDLSQNFTVSFLPADTGSLQAWALASQGQYLATLDLNGMLVLRDGQTGRLMYTLTC